MAKITRYNGNLQAFGINAGLNERTVFGGTSVSDTLDNNINTEYLEGWENVASDTLPPKEWFNAVGFTNGQLIAYLFQNGVAEYNSSQEYNDGALVIYSNIAYISNTDSNIGNTPGVDAEWDTLIPTDNLTGDLGSTDNVVLRSDGTGKYIAQGSGVTVDDSNNMDTPGTMTASQLISDVSTGTAPLAVASTTVVANLNVDKVDGYDASDFAQDSLAMHLAGTETVTGDKDFTGTLTVSSNAVWHAGNDGSGSGLDADTLDGEEGAYYQPLYPAQGAPTAQTTDDTLTAAELDTSIITVNQGAAGTSTQTLPLATDMDTYFSSVSNDTGFEFSVINISTNAAEDCTIATNTGWTLIGSMVIESNDSDRANSSGRFFARKTGTGAWVLYRIS